MLTVLRINLPGFFSSGGIPCVEAVNILAVNSSCPGCVFRLFHAAFNLERVNAAVQELRKNVQNTHILHGKRITVFIRQRSAPIPVQNRIRQSAGSGAAPSVSAPAAEEA